MSGIQTLATLVLGGAFDSTELGENDIQPDSKLIEELQQRLVTGTDDVYVELIDRAELDRVTAERDALQQRLNAADQRIDEQVQERENLIAYGRSLGLDEASTLCSRMAYDEYYPAGSRFKLFVPKTREKMGNLLIKAANAIANLPDGPFKKFRDGVKRKAEKSATA
ncbi:hypothetical protein EMIT0P2_210062 [Pseudomonas sp. IT-P2]|uniref:hypothetical protein n=1 Tax=Pseudomonas sp. IT-P2 TaxID=3026456 RepID=UPI0039E12962